MRAVVLGMRIAQRPGGSSLRVKLCVGPSRPRSAAGGLRGELSWSQPLLEWGAVLHVLAKSYYNQLSGSTPSSVILEFCFFRYPSVGGPLRRIQDLGRVVERFVVLVFLIDSTGMYLSPCPRGTRFTPTGVPVAGAGKASQARGSSELGLAPKTVGLGAFLTWKCAERVSLPRSELVSQSDVEGAPPSWGGRGREEELGAASFSTVPSLRGRYTPWPCEALSPSVCP